MSPHLGSRYYPLQNIRDEEEKCSIDNFSCDACEHRQSQKLFKVALFIVLAASLATNVGLLIGGRYHLLENLDETCTRHTTRFKTPILDDIKVSYETVRFNGSFFDETIYRRKPSPEVDHAWQALGVNYRFIPVPKGKAEDYGIPTNHVKRARSEGGGFFVNVEGLHHLHCLNMLRQTLWFNYDYYHSNKLGPFGNSDTVVKYHAGHCLDILRQQLMCTADVGMLSQVWIDEETPFPDFNTEHKCRNFEDIRRWAEERQISKDSHAELYPGDKLLGDFP